MKKILILTDGKAGHENQSKAFVRGLGAESVIVPVAFRSHRLKFLTYLLDNLGIRTLALNVFPQGIPEGDFAAVVGAGSGTFYAVKSLARKLKVPCGVLLYPRGYDIASFDCVMTPSFDRPKASPNVVVIPANLVAADSSFYEAGEKTFLERYSPSGKPAVAVIVGGPNKCSSMSPEWMRSSLERVFAETPDCEHWVTTSRRTPADVEAVVDSFPFDYKLLYSRDHYNPIPAFVKRAAKLYVTAESTGMLSEACTFGSATVHALDNLKPGPHKFRRFVEDLVAENYLDGSRKVNLSEQFTVARRLMGFVR